MERKQLGIFKFIIFLFGFAIIALAYNLFGPQTGEEGLSPADKFMWVNICLCYAVFFLPLFFSSISIKTVDTKINSTVSIWISSSIFVLAVIILIAFVKAEKIEVKYALVAEFVLFFLLSIFVYFGYFAGTHIAEVQAAEKKSLSKIGEVKSAFELLGLKAEGWGDDFYEQRSKIKKICDDVKYLSPVDTDEASKLENKLIIGANVLAESNLTPNDANSKINEIEFLIKQRKLLKK